MKIATYIESKAAGEVEATGRPARRLQRGAQRSRCPKPERWVNDAVFFPEAKEAYARLLAQGWTDSIRELAAAILVQIVFSFDTRAHAVINAGPQFHRLEKRACRWWRGRCRFNLPAMRDVRADSLYYVRHQAMELI
jgi:hypothetical protein